MDWVLVVVLVGLLGFLIEVGVDHQKQTAELRQEGKQVFEQIQTHQAQTEDIRTNTGEARGRVGRLEKEVDELKQAIAATTGELAELKESEQKRHPTRYRVETSEDEHQAGESS